MGLGFFRGTELCPLVKIFNWTQNLQLRLPEPSHGGTVLGLTDLN